MYPWIIFPIKRSGQLIFRYFRLVQYQVCLIVLVMSSYFKERRKLSLDPQISIICVLFNTLIYSIVILVLHFVPCQNREWNYCWIEYTYNGRCKAHVKKLSPSIINGLKASKELWSLGSLSRLFFFWCFYLLLSF